MTALTRKDYVRLIEGDYFGNVSSGYIDAVMDCFSEDCQVTIRHGDNPLRIFRKNPVNSETPLREFYIHLCGNFEAWFGDFVHYIDSESGRCASTFQVKLTPKPGSDYFRAGMQTLNNCNFFTYLDGLITEMTIYYSNTDTPATSDQPVSTPTGYPK